MSTGSDELVTPGSPAPRVLVMGASGKTGRAVTGALAARGFCVRAAVRSPSSAQAVYAAGAGELAVLDLASGAGVEGALDGVWGVYHLAPNVHPDEVEMARLVADAAARQGVQRLVFHSVLHPDDASMPHHLRKARAEDVVRASGVPWTVLRPAAYHQNLLPAALSGSISVPYSLDSPFSNVDLGDVAAVAATVLSEAGHERQTYDLAGPEVLSVREMAAQASEVLGRPVTAAQTPRGDWLAGPGTGLPEDARRDLLAMFSTYDREGLVGGNAWLWALLGHRPTTWAEAMEAARNTP
ncbi:NmrA family NAD(P)-binding protein [Knoellia sp. 3-2P3]|uniref:SDR family oxidoreductase n=1 Tax=unclassified Knoellia TaxID=2618719 RepID=UPI0023DC7F0F|nr:NmrA family NAD(P)-binding protein [Knoellia sp. 3-2P3]MDF2093887.1 NmrA family NAD(P)-binding protein [Knoellia sp. 3-2P3]